MEFINEKLTINRYFYGESEYNFFDKSIVQNSFNAKVIFSLFDTEETQTSIILILCMYLAGLTEKLKKNPCSQIRVIGNDY